ncbi:hypothetical protein CK203_108950 [Vitis vinifera]|uniref:Uncharacterized protein n=1 Tax=Vitis vinifera TaxID=29760 RepID=A0A438FGB1_VITVI|nr:hypothetical protein CK203_108950 [Vitis vinifera]
MQSFVVSANNEEEVKSFSDFYFTPCEPLGGDFKVGFSGIANTWLSERLEPLQVASVINFVDYSLKQGAPAGHESAGTPIRHESRTLVKESNNQEEGVGRKVHPNQALKKSQGYPHICKVSKGLVHGQERVTCDKEAFLTEQVSAIIQSKSPVKSKIRDVPPFQSTLEGHMWRSFTRLGASVNLLPYSVYKQLGLGGLKPTTITLSLADRSSKSQGG